MAEDISLRKAVRPKAVDLDGAKFTTTAMPRAVTRQIRDLEREMFAADEDETVERIGQIADLRLVSANGSKEKPSAILKRLWEAEDDANPLTYGEIITFYNDLQAAAFPT